MTASQLLPALIIPLVAWRIYSRVRRNIGRQRLRPGRLVFGLVVFSLLVAFLVAATFRHPPVLFAISGGFLSGIILGIVGLRLTRFEVTAEGKFYIPNTYIGVVLALLLLGRVVYRMAHLYNVQGLEKVPPSDLFQSPVTLAIFGLIAGYYLAYNAGVLRRSHSLAP